ncbi:MAG: hypothetical protein WDO71_06470 [Bacteroidota bacterium]
MKTIYFGCLFTCITSSVFSQFSIGAAANYTAYKGDFGKSTPGAQIRVGYQPSEKISAHFGFTYGLPIKESSSVMIMDDLGNTINVPSNIKYNFKTFTLMANYKFIGNDETAGSFYGQFGAGLVLVGYKEDISGNYDHNTYKYPQDQIEKSNENGFTINLGLGGEYKIGMPVIFAEAGLALPANQVNNYYVENVIPTHFILTLGVKIPLGSNSDY